MSKLRDNPAKVVPIRVLILACILTGVILLLSMAIDFNLMWVLLFFWLATLANLIAFRMIVVGTNVMIKKKEEGQRASMATNLMMRYILYLIVFFLAWRIDGFGSLIATFMGVQMSSLAIKLDVFVTGGD